MVAHFFCTVTLTNEYRFILVALKSIILRRRCRMGRCGFLMGLLIISRIWVMCYDIGT